MTFLELTINSTVWPWYFVRIIEAGCVYLWCCLSPILYFTMHTVNNKLFFCLNVYLMSLKSNYNIIIKSRLSIQIDVD